MQKEKHLFLVDGSSFIYRAFYATPALSRKRDGLPVNAISGFCNMLWKLLQNSRSENIASHFSVIFDYPDKTFRNEIYPDYKANRPKIPEMLLPQLPLVRLATQAFGIPAIEIQGFEADDIIATYTSIAEKRGFSVTIVSTDKDLMQLVSPTTCLYDSIKEEKIDIEKVIKKWGVPPEKMVCLQALSGDSIDNIPGIPGIGYKTAASLLQEYGNLDTILNNANQIKQKKRRENILEYADTARLSRDLVKLRTDVPITIPLDHLILEDCNGPQLITFLKALEFTRLTKRVAAFCNCDAENIESADLDSKIDIETSQPKSPKENQSATLSENIISENSPQHFFLERAKLLTQSQIKNDSYIRIRNIKDLKKWLQILENTGSASFTIITDTVDAFNSKPIGIAFSILNQEDASLLKVETIVIDLPLIIDNSLEENMSPDKSISTEEILSYLKKFFENEHSLKIGHNIKYDKLVLQRYGIIIRGFEDIMLMSYVLDSGRYSHDIANIAKKWLFYDLITRKEMLKTGKRSISIDQISNSRIQEYVVEKSNVILQLWLLLRAKLIAEKLLHVYERLDKPMIDIVAQMETTGIQIDRQLLAQVSSEISKDLLCLEEKIHNLAGEKFNISSPKQLGDILFTKLKFPGGTKTKKGQWKTTAQDLEQINCEDNILIEHILEWRRFSKIKSTYADSLPNHINQRTQRVHTFYSLASTMTGRLASLEPNLQNIPVKTNLGKKIRRAFIAPPTKKLISADYSQIELRILAHVAQINPLYQAFKNSLDIHTLVASEIFGVKIEEVSSHMRQHAKTINFSIIYGISPFRLANQLKIKRSEAADYIQRYFDRFPGIHEYIEKTKNFARKNSYVETIFGRRIYYDEINSPKVSIRNLNERAAINAPIQGSAADITRRAMILVHKSIECHKLSTKMLLQIHDELVFEAPGEEIEQVTNIITESMENACLPKINLRVPLKVDIKVSDNWERVH
ncbi:DNA polymerase I [Candidatus Liberibacter solanacearum]|uniref:DNA polymerase I n=1 Tax=Candidatus Liberibacter solanacearum TaxID=556287 RepID=A0A094YZE8_9HYPH|nr:DNA polymerase I [Candidatus Liberibacter solanacearum]KGB27335.1 DNA polymerase I [Candidatus Liberibacter solanacearum]KJZ80760.1 DNA polymerase I [Candidatus Liberibacter solanacearum]KJZ81862.1 DNA polymerase I [Candidatus Liberibacter solanacearum]KQC49674.1 DNA polymerase I [Candidatus Liberibacter solanacearum]